VFSTLAALDMTMNINITKRVRRRRYPNGAIVHLTRHVVNYRDPKSGRRRQEFFERAKDAQHRRSELLGMVAAGSYVDERAAPSVAAVVDHWLADRAGKVKPNTLAGHRIVVKHISGPWPAGSREQRAAFAATGRAPRGVPLLPVLGKVKLTELTTAAIRGWHGEVVRHCGAYTANRAASLLHSILALAEEDFGVRAPAMPNNLARRRSREKKAILSSEQIAAVIVAAQQDPEHGPFYAFPFLAGTRPSEQLGLLWDEVDFERGCIRICRIQERDGTLSEVTKTAAGTREIPMGATLRAMLLDWRIRCPRWRGELHRVFPGPGRLQAWPKPRLGGGGPLLYQNYRKRYWTPVFARLGLPYVTPHSARHSFISTLQAQGVEVGLVAKLAGHASAVVTLGHYTQAVRGGDAAVAALERAYQAHKLSSPASS
jgi:integrase